MFSCCSGGEERARSSTRSCKTRGKRTWNQILSPSSTQQTASWEESKATVTGGWCSHSVPLQPVSALYWRLRMNWRLVVWGLDNLTHPFGAVWLWWHFPVINDYRFWWEADVAPLCLRFIWNHSILIGLMNSVSLFNVFLYLVVHLCVL